MKKNPSIAKVTQKAKATKIGPLQSEVKIGKYKYILDEEKAIGGSGAGPNPSSALLGAIGGCMSATVELWSRILNIPYDSVEISVKGTLDMRGMLGIDENIKPEYQKIDVTFTIKSSADEDKVKELIDAVESHCPVYNTVKNPIEMSTALKYEKSE